MEITIKDVKKFLKGFSLNWEGYYIPTTEIELYYKQHTLQKAKEFSDIGNNSMFGCNTAFLYLSKLPAQHENFTVDNYDANLGKCFISPVKFELNTRVFTVSGTKIDLSKFWIKYLITHHEDYYSWIMNVIELRKTQIRTNMSKAINNLDKDSKEFKALKASADTSLRELELIKKEISKIKYSLIRNNDKNNDV